MAAVLPAAKEKTFPLPAGLLAWLSEKPHPGPRPNEPRPHWAGHTAKLHMALGFSTSWYDFRSGPRCSAKERDAETGLDNFIARYFSSPQGRFTSADEPFAGQDPSDPQSWNLFSYGLNNPLRYSDPDGHEPCENGVNPQNGNICTVATAKKPETETNKSPLPSLVLNVVGTSLQMAQRTQELVQPVLDFVSRPRDSNCLAGATASGSVMGAGAGMLGFAGGPAGGITVPMGFGIGGAAGYAGGMISCMSSSGPSSGGGGSKKPKSGLSGKEAASDVPSWAKGQRPLSGESGKKFAERLLDGKYGQGNYPKGPGSEFNKIQKWGDRAFE